MDGYYLISSKNKELMKNFFFLLFAALLFTACPPIEEKEVIVIGGGLAGSATAWQLAKAGKKVLLIEKQDSIYTSGSSKGKARIARSSNRGDDIWSYLHNRSVQEVQSLIKFLNSADGETTYQMSDIYTTSPVTYVGRTKIYDKLYASLIRQKVDYKMATSPTEGAELFGVSLPDSVLIQREYNAHSGTINPERLIQYLHKAIRLKGGSIGYNWKVKDINKKEDLYLLEIEDTKRKSTFQLVTPKIASAAGPFTGQLLDNIAPFFKKLIQPQRVFLAFYKIKKEVFEQLTSAQRQQLFDGFPVINSSKGTRDGSFFAMIEELDNQGQPIFKIGGHFQRSSINNLEKIWQQKLDEKEKKWSRDNMSRYFQLLNLPIEEDAIELVAEYSCVYSLTATEVPYVTYIPLENQQPNPNFIVLGGMSGVGAKGAMSYGLIGANLLLQKSEESPMYQQVSKRLGFERLQEDIANLQ